MRFVLPLALAIGLSTSAFAQTTTTSLPTTTQETVAAPAPPTSTISTSVSEGFLGDYTPALKAGYTSYNDSIRDSEIGDRSFKGKQEVSLGFKTKAGWALTGLMVQTRHEYQDAKKNKWSQSDPSLTLGHPTLLKSGDWSVGGQMRAYLPVSDRSRQYNISQYAYYTFVNGKILGGRAFDNITVNRYFYQPSYRADHTRYVLEDRSTLTQKFGNWLKVGMGQFTQVEFHDQTPTGITTEVYPFADVVLSTSEAFKATIGPRLYMPVVARNTVYEGPTGISMSNAFAELFFSASL